MHYPTRTYPFTRLRRTRSKSGLRAMVAETAVLKSDLIQPVFVKENLSGIEPIAAMPGINRFGLDSINSEIGDIVALGIRSIAIFPVVDENKKDTAGSEAI